MVREGAQYFVSYCRQCSHIRNSAWFRCNRQKYTQLTCGLPASIAGDLDPFPRLNNLITRRTLRFQPQDKIAIIESIVWLRLSRPSGLRVLRWNENSLSFTSSNIHYVTPITRHYRANILPSVVQENNIAQPKTDKWFSF